MNMRRILIGMAVLLLVGLALFAPAVFSQQAWYGGSTNNGGYSLGGYQDWPKMTSPNITSGQQNNNYAVTPYGYSLMNEPYGPSTASAEPLSPMGGNGSSCMGGAGGSSGGTSSGMGSC
jgi:hypothetical protein